MRPSWKTVGAILAIVLLLALASAFFTAKLGDGQFPAAQYRFLIRDPAGQPISGARLHIHRKGGARPSPNNPLTDHQNDTFVSDASGRIVTQRAYPLRFGGTSWELFWVIPMGGSPQFVVTVSSPGFKTFSCDVRDLTEPIPSYESDRKARIDVNGSEKEVLLFIKEIVLTR